MLNRKLTPIIAGRSVKSVLQDEAALHIEFEDGSVMKIKNGAPFTDTITGKKVKAIRQKAIEFNLDFSDGTSAEIILAEETSSVMLRRGTGELEYAD